MPSTPRIAAAAAAVISATLTATCAVSGPAQAHGRDHAAYTFAVIGDVPYGDAQIAAFPGWIQQINADRDVRSVIHVGDIKNGSSVCSDDYFDLIRKDFDGFVDPLIYTPGDNEWTDCHRVNNGSYNPLERLAKVRQVFFNRPGHTLGQHSMKVSSQANVGVPENVSWRAAGVSFAAIDVVGSNNGLQPWAGIGKTTATAEQIAAEKHRMNSAIAELRKSFAQAKQRHDRAVAVSVQADMFDPTYTPTPDDISAFTPLVQELVKQSSTFAGSVYVINGDSHVYNSDKPLAAGSKWLATYGVKGAANNLTRITVDGSSNNKDWLKVSVNPKRAGDVLTWTRIPYTN